MLFRSRQVGHASGQQGTLTRLEDAERLSDPVLVDGLVLVDDVALECDGCGIKDKLLACCTLSATFDEERGRERGCESGDSTIGAIVARLRGCAEWWGW